MKREKPKEIDSQLYKIMHDKMLEQGWENVRRFTEASGVPFSLETTRRLFNECTYKGIAPATIAIIARYLGFSTAEIRNLLREYTTDEEIWPMIGVDDGKLSKDEEHWLQLYHELSANPDLYQAVITQIDSACKLAGTKSRVLPSLKRR